jgi:amino acid permease
MDENQKDRRAFPRVIEKVTSGRWLLTMACALVFSVCAIRGTIETDAVVALLGAVFVAYFQRNDRNGKDTQ